MYPFQHINVTINSYAYHFKLNKSIILAKQSAISDSGVVAFFLVTLIIHFYCDNKPNHLISHSIILPAVKTILPFNLRV